MEFSRQAIKDAVPWAVKAHRFGRWTTNQVRFPIVSSALELQARGRIMNGPFKGLRARKLASGLTITPSWSESTRAHLSQPSRLSLCASHASW